MTRHLLRTIDSLFQPNVSSDRYRLNPICIKKLKKGETHWSTTKTVLRWAIDAAHQILTLPQSWNVKFDKALNAIPKDAHSRSKKK